MLSKVNEWRKADTEDSSSIIKHQKEKLQEVEGRLQRLLDLCVEGIISKEEFPLLHEKTELRDKISTVESKGSVWIELTRDFIHEANQARKAAFCETLSGLRGFHKRIGSNLKLGGPISSTQERQRPRPSKDREVKTDSSCKCGKEQRKTRGENFLIDSSENPSCFAFTPEWWPKASGNHCPSESLAKIRRKPFPELHVEYPDPWKILSENPKGQKWWRRGESNPRPK